MDNRSMWWCPLSVTIMWHLWLKDKWFRVFHLQTPNEVRVRFSRVSQGCVVPQVGLERFHGVGIMGINSMEWVIASIGAIMAG